MWLVHNDHQLLFQRLLTAVICKIAWSIPIKPSSTCWEYIYTTQLTTNASLSDALWVLMPPNKPIPPGYVLGISEVGALMSRVWWNHASTCEEIWLLFHQGEWAKVHPPCSVIIIRSWVSYRTWQGRCWSVNCTECPAAAENIYFCLK